MVKRLGILLAFLFVLFSAGCIGSDQSVENGNETVSLEDAAEIVAANIEGELDVMVAAMRTAGDVVLASGGDATAAEEALKSLHESVDYSVSIIYADKNEVCIAVYPDIIKDSVGKNLSSYGTDEAYFAGRDVAMENYRLLEDGFKSCVLLIPLYEDGAFAGYISVDLNLTKLLGEEEAKLFEKYGYNLWVVEPSGIQIYDTNADEAGLNILEDERYSAADVHAAAVAITGEKSGITSYRFLDTGADESVDKDVAWTTLSYGGQDWRVGVTASR